MRNIIKLALGLVSVMGLAACSEPEQVLADLEQGQLAGFREDSADWFRNIPYAAPPVGELRWQPPQPAPVWQGARDASEYGPACMQSTLAGDFLDRLLKGNGLSDLTVSFIGFLQPYLFTTNYAEDCLSLNIVTPAADGQATRPVMIWIHGGSYESGSGSTSFYNSTAFARRDIVLVTINYRLNIFGFYGHPSLSSASPDRVSGNYGMLDQIAAIDWVRDNIAVFGGDPGNITVFGESAGAYSVGTMMAAPAARDKFQRAILQSGCGFTLWGRLREDWRHKTALERHGAAIAGGAGEAALRRMMAMPAVGLMALYDNNPAYQETFRPVIDGLHLPDSVADIFANGDQAGVPMLIGWNGDEGSLFAAGGDAPLVHRDTWPDDKAGYDAMVLEGHEEMGPAILAAYPWLGDAYHSNARLHGDSRFSAPCLEAVISHREAGHDAWIYNFDRIPPDPNQTIGAYHAAEVAMVFGTMFGLLPSDDHDPIIVQDMGDRWAAFARDGKVDWPVFDPADPKVLRYDNKSIKVVKPANIEALNVLRAWTEKLQQED